jgi:Na+/melibiose symporter-like transporter
MAIFINMARTAFFPLSTPKDEETITLNCYKATSRGALVSGGTALVSFIFNRFLAQEGTWKAVAPYVFKASLWSFVVFTVFAFCIRNKITRCVREYRNDPIYDKKFNDAMSLTAKSSALVGMSGAAVAFALKFVAPNSIIGSLTNRFLCPLLGLGTAGSVLWIFTAWQQAQMGKKS